MKKTRWFAAGLGAMMLALLQGCGESGGEKPGPRLKVHAGVGVVAAEEMAALTEKGANVLVLHFDTTLHESFKAQLEAVEDRARKLGLKTTPALIDLVEGPQPVIASDTFRQALQSAPACDAIISLGGSLPSDAAQALQGRPVKIVVYGSNSNLATQRARAGLCHAALVPVGRFERSNRTPRSPKDAFAMYYAVMRFDDKGDLIR